MAGVDEVVKVEGLDETRPPVARGTRSVLLAVFALSSALHLYSWYVNPARPSLTNDIVTGWYGGTADQINYAREARALADGKLPGIYWDYDRRRARPDRPPNAELADYAYGLGYPILGAPFVKLGLRRDPFVIPDMVAFGLIICLALLLARRFLSDAAALMFASVLAVASPVLRLTVAPWNTTITMIAVLASLVFATSERRNWRVGALLGVALSLCYAARFGDVLWPIPIAAAGIVAGWRKNIKGCLSVVAVAGGMLVATYLAVGWTQHVVFGNFFTNPYHYHLHNGTPGDSLAGFHLGQVPRAFKQVFVTATWGSYRVQEPHTSVLRAFPWVVAAPFGLVALLRRRHPYRAVLMVGSATSVIASVSYLAYWSGTGADIENDNIRFFASWFPFWALLAAVAFAALIERGAATLRNVGAPSASQSASRQTRNRWIAAIAIVVVALAGISYIKRDREAPAVIDLVQRFADAERKPAGAGEETFATRQVKIGGDTKLAIYAHPPSRLTWKVTVPDDGWLRTAIGIDEQAWDRDGDGVVFRVGVNDHHGGYMELLSQHVDPRATPGDRRWLPILINLTRYSGSRVDLIFNTDTSMPGKGDDPRNDFAYWGSPVIGPRPYVINAR